MVQDRDFHFTRNLDGTYTATDGTRSYQSDEDGQFIRLEFYDKDDIIELAREYIIYDDLATIIVSNFIILCNNKIRHLTLFLF